MLAVGGILFLLLARSIEFAHAAIPVPQWIWGHGTDETQERYFRKVFVAPPLLWKAVLSVAARDEAEVFLNGKRVAGIEGADAPVRVEVTVRMNQGANVRGIRAVNRQDPAGLLVRLEMQGAKAPGFID